MFTDSKVITCRIFLLIVLLAGTALAADNHDCATIKGKVVDGHTGLPLPMAHVRLTDLDMGQSTDVNGSFHLLHVSAGEQHLLVSHVAYRDHLQVLQLSECDTTSLTISLYPKTHELEELHVTHREQLHRESLHNPVIMKRTAELQENLGLTIAESLEEEIGLASRSMGPAPARPMIRGLSGDRLLLLEDGSATGDLSATSADHAVVIDPIGAQSVRLLRGPESLLYGAGSVAGVVDAERGLIPGQRSQNLAVSLGSYADTGHPGGGFTIRADLPVSHMDLTADMILRKSGDQETPSGSLKNSGIGTQTYGVGLALNQDRLHLGVSGNHYRSDYGIPGGFVGGHPNGVDIEMSKQGFRVECARLFDKGLLERVELVDSFSRYHHAEYESSGALGIEFGSIAFSQDLDLHLRSGRKMAEGRLRFSLGLRDFATGGLSHSPDVKEQEFAIGYLQHLNISGWHLEAALRTEYALLEPDEERISTIVGWIRERSFLGWAAALEVASPEWHMFGGLLDASLGLMRGFRPPTVEELFSGGPHLAAYSYEIGNPELDAESSMGVEAGLRHQAGACETELKLYHTLFDGFIFPSFTGEFAPRRADLYLFRTTSRKAHISGLEFEHGRTIAGFDLRLGGSLVRGELSNGVPLPETPPDRISFNASREVGAFKMGLALLAVDRQDRVYRADAPDSVPELATAGWSRLDADLMWRVSWLGAFHQVQVGMENVLGLEYRNHLSRIRSVMPEADRTLKLTWRAWF